MAQDNKCPQKKSDKRGTYKNKKDGIKLYAN